jgi:hypothetical protein
LYPGSSFAKLIDGTISHNTTNDPKSYLDALRVDQIEVPPFKIQEDAGRGTAINCAIDQERLLQYWAWARQSNAVGIALPIDNYRWRRSGGNVCPGVRIVRASKVAWEPRGRNKISERAGENPHPGPLG